MVDRSTRYVRPNQARGADVLTRRYRSRKCALHAERPCCAHRRHRSLAHHSNAALRTVRPVRLRSSRFCGCSSLRITTGSRCVVLRPTSRMSIQRERSITTPPMRDQLNSRSGCPRRSSGVDRKWCRLSAEEYPGSGAVMARHSSLPVRLFRATQVDPSPPAMQINRSPSTNGEDAVPQFGTSKPYRSLKSTDQTTHPSLTRRHSRLPSAPTV